MEIIFKFQGQILNMGSWQDPAQMIIDFERSYIFGHAHSYLVLVRRSSFTFPSLRSPFFKLF